MVSISPFRIRTRWELMPPFLQVTIEQAQAGNARGGISLLCTYFQARIPFVGIWQRSGDKYLQGFGGNSDCSYTTKPQVY